MSRASSPTRLRLMIVANRIMSLLLASVILAPIPAMAQARDITPEADAPPAPVDTNITQTPTLATGRIGARQTREDTARATGIQPMARISNRISNRVQSRLRNRLDRDYSERSHLQ